MAANESYIFTTETDYSKEIANFFGKQQFCDVKLKLDGGTHLMAHRVILAAASEYFQVMLSGSFKEAVAAEVGFDQIDGRTLKSVIGFIYTKSIELHDDTVEDIFKAAHLFQLEALQDGCFEFLGKLVNTTNCIGIAVFAQQYDYAEVHSNAFAYALEHFMEEGCQREFVLLNADQVTVFISSDLLCVNSEEDVFHSLMSWIDYDKKNRESSLDKLIQNVRLGLLLPKFITDNVHPLYASISKKNEDLVVKSYMWHSNPSYLNDILPEEHIRLRSLKDVFIGISGWGRLDNVLQVGLYYYGFAKWLYREWPAPSECTTDFGYTLSGDNLIIGGGAKACGNPSKLVFSLDMRTLNWTQQPSMVYPTNSCQMTTVNGIVYALQKDSKKIEKWDPVSNVWEMFSSIYCNSSNSPVKLGAVNGALYCLYWENSYKLGIYNIDSRSWINKSNLNNFSLSDFKDMVSVNIKGVDYLFELFGNEVLKINLKSNPPSIVKLSFSPTLNALKFSVLKNNFIMQTSKGFKLYCALEFGNWEKMPAFPGESQNIILL